MCDDNRSILKRTTIPGGQTVLYFCELIFRYSNGSKSSGRPQHTGPNQESYPAESDGNHSQRNTMPSQQLTYRAVCCRESIDIVWGTRKAVEGHCMDGNAGEPAGSRVPGERQGSQKRIA